ncbi:MAG: molybdenum cofactor biosynthesis protein MoaE [Deltaproteobacteria bacterium]|nr:molybdenum cofactor biosynthesis protein MoaE [Deltaproteobacteria bacterium]
MSLTGIRDQPLDPGESVAAVSDDAAGAVVTFLGAVRNHHAGQVVTRLDYKAYERMAESELAAIATEIEAELPGVRVACLHRVGTLAVGDLAVVCAASAAHRAEAFTACREIIERVKTRVPIWKREHGPDGPYWVGWQAVADDQG